VKSDTYVLVYLIGEFGSKHRGQKEANTQANITEATYSGAEVICVGEKGLRMKRGQLRNGKDGDASTVPGKVVNMR